MHRKDKAIRYEVYALKRMRQRGVSEHQFEQSVKFPDTIDPARRKGALKLTRRFSKNKRIVVIVDEGRDFIRIVTASKG